MVDGDIEKPLNLGRVQVDKQRAVGARRHQQIGDELGRDGHARTVFSILPRIAVIRCHYGDPAR